MGVLVDDDHGCLEVAEFAGDEVAGGVVFCDVDCPVVEAVLVESLLRMPLIEPALPCVLFASGWREKETAVHGVDGQCLAGASVRRGAQRVRVGRTVVLGPVGRSVSGVRG